MKTYGGVEVQLHHSRPRHQMNVSGQFHAPAALHPRERPPGTHWIEAWVGNITGLVATVKRKISCPCKESNHCHPTRSFHYIDRKLASPINLITQQDWRWVHSSGKASASMTDVLDLKPEGTPAILTVLLRGCPHSLQTHCELVYKY
jgi:hypothetical protein